jgi:hypothetical protein
MVTSYPNLFNFFVYYLAISFFKSLKRLIHYFSRTPNFPFTISPPKRKQGLSTFVNLVGRTCKKFPKVSSLTYFFNFSFRLSQNRYFVHKMFFTPMTQIILNVLPLVKESIGQLVVSVVCSDGVWCDFGLLGDDHVDLDM